MSLMKKYRDDVIRINDISDIYKILSEMIDILTVAVKAKPPTTSETKYLTSYKASQSLTIKVLKSWFRNTKRR